MSFREVCRFANLVVVVSSSDRGGYNHPIRVALSRAGPARVSDETIATVGNDQNDVLDWFRYPKIRYEEQIELLLIDLMHKWKRKNQLSDSSVVEEEFDYFSRIVGVRGDSTGLGDFPMEFLKSNRWASNRH